jgi:amidase
VTGDPLGAFVFPPRILAAGPKSGPLGSVTLAVKDVIDVKGTVTGAGNPTFAKGRVAAAAHADVVARLVDAGATVVGKSITDELTYSLSGTNVHFGTPINTAALGRIPGGSSSGSAAAVAAGLCDLALGTDTGGSIRVPASYCGIIGWRPSHGAVSDHRVVHLSRSFDTVGLFARDLAVLTRAAAVLLDGLDETGSAETAPLTDALVIAELVDLIEPKARSTITGSDAADSFRLDIDLSDFADAFRVLQGYEAWAEHGSWTTRVQPAMGPGIAARFEAASQITAEQVERADAVRAKARRVVADATADGRVLVGPAAAGGAPRIDEPSELSAAWRAKTLQLTCLAGLAGAPVVVLPRARDGQLPLGVAYLSAPGSDRQLLRWAAALPAGRP